MTFKSIDLICSDDIDILYPSDILDNYNKLNSLENNKLYPIQFNTDVELKLLLHYFNIDISKARKS